MFGKRRDEGEEEEEDEEAAIEEVNIAEEISRLQTCVVDGRRRRRSRESGLEAVEEGEEWQQPSVNKEVDTKLTRGMRLDE